MGIVKLAHYSIRTLDLEASGRFYTEIMQFRIGFRPPFDFPGIWLYLGEDETDFGVVHIIGIDPNDPVGLRRYLGERPTDGPPGTGTVDHIAFLARDWPSMRARLEAAGQEFFEREV